MLKQDFPIGGVAAAGRSIFIRLPGRPVADGWGSEQNL
jgi:hypothetical protein